MISKEPYLSVIFLESTARKIISTGLGKSNLLLSPKAHVNNNKYMTCVSCCKNIRKPRVDQPPRFVFSDGWAIGEVPYTVNGDEIEELLATVLAKIRAFANIYLYTASEHKSIKGDHTFL